MRARTERFQKILAAGRGTRWAALLLACCAFAARAEPFHEICAACHPQIAEDFRSHPHLKAGLDCDLCHGESKRHRDAMGSAEADRVAAPDEVVALCGACHDRPGPESDPAFTLLKQYAASRHGRLVSSRARTRAPHCGTCHGVHRLRSARAVELGCRRCHRALPEACGAGATDSPRCSLCHLPHEFAVRR